MVRRNARRAIIAITALLAAGSSALGAPVPNPLFFPTGNAEQDINRTRFPEAFILLDNQRFPDNLTNDVAQQEFITAQNWLSGWNYKDIRIAYDARTDTAGIAVNFFKRPDGTPINIAGDADGNGDPGAADPRTIAAGGIDLPNLSGRESITVALDTNSDGTPDIVAGVPAEKTGSGIDAFTVASYNRVSSGTQPGIERSYGQTLNQHLGTLAYNPSAATPDFEFTIKEFSKLPGIDRVQAGQHSLEFTVRAYAGTLDDVVAGEDLFFGEVRIPFVPGGEIPEPSTILMWAMLAGFAGWRYRRRANAAS